MTYLISTIPPGFAESLIELSFGDLRDNNLRLLQRVALVSELTILNGRGYPTGLFSLLRYNKPRFVFPRLPLEVNLKTGVGQIVLQFFRGKDFDQRY